VRLLDAEYLAGLGLCNAELPDEAVDLQCKLGLQEFLIGAQQNEIGKNVSAQIFSLRSQCLHPHSLRAGLAHQQLP